jgi:hypothetical protein
MPSPTDVATSQGTPPLPDDVLERLADLGHVPATQRECFFESVRMNVQTACELDGLGRLGLANKRGESLAHAALALYDVIGNLNERERSSIERILEGKAKFIFHRISNEEINEGINGLEEAAYQLALLFSLVTGRPRPRVPSQPPDPPVAGRKSGTVEHWAFQNFVSDLLISTTAANGRLTLSRTYRTGSLIKAIDVLKPYLPDHFVPTPLPTRTLQRVKDACSRAYEAVPDNDAS